MEMSLWLAPGHWLCPSCGKAILDVLFTFWYVSSVSDQVKYRIWATQFEKEIQEEDLKVGVAFEMYFLDNVEKNEDFLASGLLD